MSKLRLSPLPGIPFVFESHGTIAIDIPAGKEADVEAMLQRAIDDLHALPPADAAPPVAAHHPGMRMQPPNVVSGGGIRPPPQPHGHQGNAIRPNGAPAPPPPPPPGGSAGGAGMMPQPAIAPPPRPLFSDQPPPQPQLVPHPRAAGAVVIGRVAGAPTPAAGQPQQRANGRVRLGPGRPEDVAAAAAAAAEAAAAAPPPPPPVPAVIVAEVPMAARGGGASPGPNQLPDGTIMGPNGPLRGAPMPALPQGPIFGPPPPPPK